MGTGTTIPVPDDKSSEAGTGDDSSVMNYETLSPVDGSWNIIDSRR